VNIGIKEEAGPSERRQLCALWHILTRCAARLRVRTHEPCSPSPTERRSQTGVTTLLPHGTTGREADTNYIHLLLSSTLPSLPPLPHGLIPQQAGSRQEVH